MVIYEFRDKMIKAQIAHNLFIVYAMRLAYDFNREFPHITFSNIFQPGALVLDVLYFQIQKGSQFAGKHLIPRSNRHIDLPDTHCNSIFSGGCAICPGRRNCSGRETALDLNRLQNYTDKNIAYWTKRAPGYSDVNREELRTAQRKVWSQALDTRIRLHFEGRSRKDIHVLDVGTGPGFFAIILTELGCRVTAVDYTSAMLERARRNAGSLAEKICFQQMNAEELSFPDGSFDVIVSRNLTWNLSKPEQAYAQWVRVLKQGGLLLNFDANWYRYLYDAQAETGHHSDRENVRAAGAADDTAGTDVAAMEAIARQAPLSRCRRPQWDQDILGRLGMKVSADTEVWKQVWTRDEWINNASTPMFLITASRTARGGATLKKYVFRRLLQLIPILLIIGGQTVVKKKPEKVVAVMSGRLKLYFYFVLRGGTTLDSLQQTVKPIHVVGSREHIRQDFTFRTGDEAIVLIF